VRADMGVVLSCYGGDAMSRCRAQISAGLGPLVHPARGLLYFWATAGLLAHGPLAEPSQHRCQWCSSARTCRLQLRGQRRHHTCFPLIPWCEAPREP